jgi:hypothetical protein
VYTALARVIVPVPLMTPFAELNPGTLPLKYEPTISLPLMPSICPAVASPVESKRYTFPAVRLTIPSLHGKVVRLLAAGMLIPVVGWHIKFPLESAIAREYRSRLVATVMVTGLPVQVAVPLVQVAVVGAEVHPLPAAVTDALVKVPLVILTVAVEAVHPLLNPLRRSVPVPEKPLPPLIPVTAARPVSLVFATA